LGENFSRHHNVSDGNHSYADHVVTALFLLVMADYWQALSRAIHHDWMSVFSDCRQAQQPEAPPLFDVQQRGPSNSQRFHDQSFAVGGGQNLRSAVLFSPNQRQKS
jgi:hypothetical protein